MPKLVIIGDLGLDLIMGPLDHWPEAGTEKIVDRLEMRSGFSAGNSALAALWLGHDCQLFSAVGSDHFGDWLDERLSGVARHLVRIPGHATTLSVAMVRSDGERSFLTSRGHLENFNAAMFLDRIERAAPGDIALLTGYFLLPGLRPAYESLLLRLRDLGYRIAIDTGWPSEGWTPQIRAEVLNWLPLCDILLLNEIEVAGLADIADTDQALFWLANHMAPNGTAVGKLGAQGSAAAHRGQIARGSAPSVSVFDTVGAGDSFNASFLAALQKGQPLAEALNAGCLGASSILSRFPRSSIDPGALASVLAGSLAAVQPQ